MLSKILAVAALKSELRALLAHREALPAELQFSRCGIGRRVEQTIPHLIRRHSPDSIVVFGTAGWLGAADNFKPGRTFLIDRALHLPQRPSTESGAHDPDIESVEAGSACLEGARERISILPATVLTVDQPLTDDHERERHAAASGALLVDMETFFIFKIAASRGIPCIGFRVVTDRAGAAAQAEFDTNSAGALEQGAKSTVEVIQRLHDYFSRR